MKYHIIIQPPAERDIQEAFSWIAKESPGHADLWRKGLAETIGSLEVFPERGALVPEDDVFAEEIRELLYGKKGGIYRILFTIRERTVHILHVRHGSRKILS